MKRFIFCLTLIAALSLAASAVDCNPDPTIYTLNCFEGVAGNAIDWGNHESIDSPNNTARYSYENTIGVTHCQQSLHMTQSGWAQSLAFDLNASDREAFMQGTNFLIDMTVAANDGTITGGYTQIYEVVMNAAGPGWTAVATGTPINFYWWPGSGQRTQTLNIDYTAFRDAITSTGYVQIIFALNTGGGAPPDMYFDNARITGIPEPATIALLSLGLTLLRKRS